MELIAYDPEWVLKYLRESAAVAEAMGEILVAIHHVGSTAIPGIRAKPIIDMLAEVRDLSGLDARTAQMETLGYEVMGEFGIPGRRYFRKNDPDGLRSHQVHAFESGSPQIKRHLAFRDFLRAHPHFAAQYNFLKIQLAERFPNDVSRYTDGKDDFIREVDAKAVMWVASSAFEGM